MSIDCGKMHLKIWIMYNASEHYEGWLIENIVINH